MPDILPGMAGLASRYDAFILDLWGVIHDGTKPYPGAADTLARLKEMGKATVLLSNAPRRTGALIEAMTKMGIGRDLYGAVMSSGEAMYLELKSRANPDFARLGRRLYYLGPDRDRNVYEGLDYKDSPLEDADFVLNTGPVDFSDSVADYEDVLRRAARRSLPMLCANPDITVIRLGDPVVCAGALAQRYRELGGQVIERGKPDPAIYPTCLDALDLKPGQKALAIGDGLHTDIQGANAADIDSALVVGGIHLSELGMAWGEMPDAKGVVKLLSSHKGRPRFILPAFVW
ncbi:MAG: TIGR01459 family HAD-type hydrolase [Alphaproteobacteria bacterium]|nr:TIGR01459 family HAD-type hydrolase [Alphaproteobacteria bacterium]